MPEDEQQPAPRTKDLAIDAALDELAGAAGAEHPTAADLDGVLAAGEHVHQTLTSRLNDLGS